jgi:ABC-type transport system involved in cytochrome c biogenesis permease subunit
MRRKPRAFSFSRILVIACSTLQVLLALVDVTSRVKYETFAMMQWLYPALMFGCGLAGYIAQAPASSPLVRPVVTVLNVLLIVLTVTGLLVAFGVIDFQQIAQPLVMLGLALMAILPGWVNMIAISMLPTTGNEGPLF